MNRPWETEPNEKRFEAYGFDCLIIRARVSLHLCGYVAVPESHPLHKVGYGEICEALEARLEKRMTEPAGKLGLGQLIGVLSGEPKSTPEMAFDVHGGITFSDYHAMMNRAWAFGFDCAHDGDFQPGRDYSYGGTYRDIDYVERHTRNLAKQLSEIQQPGTVASIQSRDPGDENDSKDGA